MSSYILLLKKGLHRLSVATRVYTDENQSEHSSNNTSRRFSLLDILHPRSIRDIFRERQSKKYHEVTEVPTGFTEDDETPGVIIPDIVAIRKNIVKVSQSEFSRKFHFNLRTLQAWERKAVKLSQAAEALFRIIAVEPKYAESVLNSEIEVDVDYRELRERLSLSRENFAKYYNISLNSLVRWENEQKCNAHADSLFKLINDDPERIAAIILNSPRKLLKTNLPSSMVHPTYGIS